MGDAAEKPSPVGARTIELEAKERGVSARWLREFCAREGIPVVGTRKTPIVRTRDVDRALNRQFERIAENEADADEINAGLDALARGR